MLWDWRAPCTRKKNAEGEFVSSLNSRDCPMVVREVFQRDLQLAWCHPGCQREKAIGLFAFAVSAFIHRPDGEISNQKVQDTIHDTPRFDECISSSIKRSAKRDSNKRGASDDGLVLVSVSRSILFAGWRLNTLICATTAECCPSTLLPTLNSLRDAFWTVLRNLSMEHAVIHWREGSSGPSKEPPTNTYFPRSAVANRCLLWDCSFPFQRQLTEASSLSGCPWRARPQKVQGKCFQLQVPPGWKSPTSERFCDTNGFYRKAGGT